MNDKRTKLAKAVTMALAGAALSVGAASSATAATTMYNTFNAGGLNANTDGWTRVYDGADADTIATGPESQGNKGTILPWLGTSGGALPFGYTGSSHLNWAVTIGGVGDSAEISAADSTKYSSSPYYTAPAEIDTGAGAWQDASAAPTGWKHQSEIGIIETTQNTIIKLAPAVLAGGAPAFAGNFGITVFDGMDTNTGNYSHHGRWNCPTCAAPNTALYDKADPFGTTGLGIPILYDGTVDLNNPLFFPAQAGHKYTIYLGGAGVGTWSTNLSDYKLNIAAVPVPAAVWLFGSALAGMGIVGRRKEKASVTA